MDTFFSLITSSVSVMSIYNYELLSVCKVYSSLVNPQQTGISESLINQMGGVKLTQLKVDKARYSKPNPRHLKNL